MTGSRAEAAYIDVAFGCSGGCGACGGVCKVVLQDFCEEGFEFSDVHCANGHCVIYSNHCFVFLQWVPGVCGGKRTALASQLQYK